MALGYEGYATLEYDPDGTGIQTVFLCTGSSVPKARQRLDSGAGYGGEISTPVSEIGIGSPYNFDWPLWDGSANFDLTKKLFTQQLNPWIFHRQTPATFRMVSRYNNYQVFERCYWNSISLTAAEGAAVTGSFSFAALDRDYYNLAGDGYIAGRTGAIGLQGCTGSDWFGSSGDIPALNPGSEPNIPPIPFWTTKVKAPTLIDFISWTVTFSQDVTKFFGCFGLQGPLAGLQAPAYVAVGPMTVTFECEYVPITNAPLFTAPDNFGNLNVYFDLRDENTYLKLKNLELETANDDVADQGSTAPITATYAVYELVA